MEIRILGRITRRVPGVAVHKLAQVRLHTRTIVRDGNTAFVGSQSLRAIELDARREAGIIFRNPKVISRLLQTFEDDWTVSEKADQQTEDEAPAVKVAKRVAKLVIKELPEVAPVLNGAVKELVGDTPGVELNPEEVESIVKDAVKEAVKGAVSDMVQEAVEKSAEGGQ